MDSPKKNNDSEVLLIMIASELMLAFQERHKLATLQKEEDAKTYKTEIKI
jgi:hypothetical protein